MRFIVPEPKRVSNLAKHDYDLADLERHFSWDDHLSGPAKDSRTGRSRRRLIGVMDGHVVVAIVSALGTEATAVISIRDASAKERAVYEQD